jgi:hypothetical protein
MRAWPLLAFLLITGPAYAQRTREVVTHVWVHDVPGPPQGDFWHPAVEHLLSSFTDPASIYPNVEVCARPLRVETPSCTRICWEFKGDSHGDGKHPSTECQPGLRVRLLPDDPRMLLEVIDMEHIGSGARVHAVIARNIVVPDPSHCTDDNPCRLTLPQGINTARGTLSLSFGTELHGVLGAPPPPPSPVAPASGGTSAAPASGPSAWQQAVNWAKTQANKWAQGKDPTANTRETVDRATAQLQAKLNACLLDVARNNGLRARISACANTSGKAFEECMYTLVLYDNEVALTQGYACSRQYQDQIDTFAQTGLKVWLKSKICGFGQWIGLNGC